MFGRPQKGRYVFNGAFGMLAAKLDDRINGKQQQNADQRNYDDIEHHRVRMPFTVLVCRLSSVIICSGVSATAHARSGRSGSAFIKVASQIATPIMYAIGGVIPARGLNFVPNSERSKKATSDPAALTPKPKTMPAARCPQRR